MLFEPDAEKLAPDRPGVVVGVGRLRAWVVAAALGTLAAIPLACGSDDARDAGAGPGGTYRVQLTDFGFSNGFDPTGEYTTWSWDVYGNLLTRSLLGYRHVEGAAGTELIPDLATEVPVATGAGRTWRFTLRPGVKFAPPVNREVTAKDVVYALERLGTPSLAAQYGFYYSDIVGMEAFTAGKASSISGIRTPDPHTIVITTSRPVPDFPYRMAMPATAPIPREVGACFDQPGEYGRSLIATGPYMIEGSESVDIASCRSIRPVSGFSPTSRLTLVRNPAYDPATDTPDARENYPDRFEFTINTNVNDIYQKIRKGEIEDAVDSVPGAILAQASRDDELRDSVRTPPADAVNFLFMSLAEPPFDDVHVRRAVNWVMDRDGLRRAAGGPPSGEIATHAVPPAVLGNDPAITDYDPYPSEGHAGSIERAKEEMKRSRYDTDGDGVCDAEACDDVVFVGPSSGASLAPIVRESLARIGVAVTTREVAPTAATGLLTTPSRRISTGVWSWGKDYPDAGGFMVLFDGRNILEQGNTNFSLVGLTPDSAATVGVPYPKDGVPNVDADIDRCAATSGADRTACWIALDKKLTEEIAPWVPWLFANETHLIGPAVTKWEYDQFATETAYAHVAVDPAKQR